MVFVKSEFAYKHSQKILILLLLYIMVYNRFLYVQSTEST